MAAERYLSRRIPDLRVGYNIDEIDKKLIPASIHPWFFVVCVRGWGDMSQGYQAPVWKVPIHSLVYAAGSV